MDESIMRSHNWNERRIQHRIGRQRSTRGAVSLLANTENVIRVTAMNLALGAGHSSVAIWILCRRIWER